MRTNRPKSRRKKAKFNEFSVLRGLSDAITMLTQKTPRFLPQNKGIFGRIWADKGRFWQIWANSGRKSDLKRDAVFRAKWGAFGTQRGVLFRPLVEAQISPKQETANDLASTYNRLTVTDDRQTMDAPEAPDTPNAPNAPNAPVNLPAAPDTRFPFGQNMPTDAQLVKSVVSLLPLAVLASFLSLLPSCSKPPPLQHKVRHHARPYTGPAYLRGTIGSRTLVSNNQPMLVSGYGLVVGLRGTGSNVVPASIREKMFRLARQGGLGSARLDYGHMTPARVLASRDTAIVAIEAFVPAGATWGTRGDLLVSTWPQTQVTSLAGGILWTTDLSILGLNPSMDNRKLAKGRGPIYINPYESPDASKEDVTQGIVIGGLTASTNRNIELTLREPSYALAHLLRDRINERFPQRLAQFIKDPHADKNPVAIAHNDSLITIHVPKRYRRNPQHLMGLITHLFLQGGPSFEPEKAKELAMVLIAQPDQAANIALAWEALGASALPVLRQYYDHRRQEVRFTAMEAGARLGDQRVAGFLIEQAKQPDSATRQQVARLLGFLPRSIRGARMLHLLVDDPDKNVRIAAYESLARIGDTLIKRTEFTNAAGFKFVLDLVPSDKSLIYITHQPIARVVIFNALTGFKGNAVLSLWKDTLMLRRDSAHLMTVYYQPSAQDQPLEPQIRPTVANMVMLLGHKPSSAKPMTGFDLSFGQVANVLHEMVKLKRIDSEIQLQVNPIAKLLAKHRSQSTGKPRPDFGTLVGE